ncbi:redox-regulated ATPase YchF [Candidatus Mycoplasma mahonii]|uniref:redox-regulated ATPase YchF n=1 Tax=Candidatus Mycoplasma mahonii TaxID=3004105 RepID=UPI0026F2246A|nr:redox-regulated ATPase YchF [Candidatus Mycoplasma mahonii]WKX02582.1 redox-regulated ATPase YchF [Candidatus Mycoplasma mahonii]
MALKAGIVGLPNVGKSTLFNAITNSQVEAANYPFATIEPNIGVVELSDERLPKLVKIVNPKRVLPATFEFTDIAGLVEGASKGEGLGNKFLANIRETDAIIQVVRCFEDENITHIYGNIDPVRDMQTINLELILADLDTVLNVIRRTERLVKNTSDKFAKAEFCVVLKLKDAFEKEIPGRLLAFTSDEMKIAKGYNLLTMKPLLYVGNVAEEFVATPEDSELFKLMKDEASKLGVGSIGISAAIEGELSQLEGEDKQMFLTDLGIKSSGLDRLTRASFQLLNLSTYFTAGVKEVRAWTFKNGYTAPQCAGIIHTDFEKGFIRAEVISYDEYVSNGGENGAKEAGKARLEGKDYIMVDGDIVHFRFNV